MIILEVAKACLDRKGIFSLTNIIHTTGLSRKRVRRALEKLEREGHIKRVSETESPLPNFSKGRPNKEPRYTPKISLAMRIARARDVRQNNQWDAIWRAARHLRLFTKRDGQSLPALPLRMSGTSPTHFVGNQRTAYVALAGLVLSPGCASISLFAPGCLPVII